MGLTKMLKCGNMDLTKVKKRWRNEFISAKNGRKAKYRGNIDT